MRFAIIKSAGSNRGAIKSLHRSFAAAAKAQPAIYFALVRCTDQNAKRGDLRPDLLVPMFGRA